MPPLPASPRKCDMLNLAAQGSRTRRACRRVRMALGGPKPSKPPQGVFRQAIIHFAIAVVSFQRERKDGESGGARFGGNWPQRRENIGGGYASAPQLVEKGRRCRPFPPGHVSPAPWGAAGETCRETLLRKASEPAAHVAGFGLYLEGFGPPNLPKGVFRRSVRGGIQPSLCVFLKQRAEGGRRSTFGPARRRGRTSAAGAAGACALRGDGVNDRGFPARRSAYPRGSNRPR